MMSLFFKNIFYHLAIHTKTFTVKIYNVWNLFKIAGEGKMNGTGMAV